MPGDWRRGGDPDTGGRAGRRGEGSDVQLFLLLIAILIGLPPRKSPAKPRGRPTEIQVRPRQHHGRLTGGTLWTDTDVNKICATKSSMGDGSPMGAWKAQPPSSSENALV